MPKPLKTLAVYDAGDQVLDRYTVYIDVKANHVGDLTCLCLSERPNHPQGFSQFSSGSLGPHNGNSIELSELSQDLQDHIALRLSNGKT
jgi:hypothetical protein